MKSVLTLIVSMFALAGLVACAEVPDGSYDEARAIQVDDKGYECLTTDEFLDCAEECDIAVEGDEEAWYSCGGVCWSMRCKGKRM